MFVKNILLSTLLAAAALSASALPADYYAADSRLAEGRWVRVKVETAGMHVISDSELRNLGFSDPSKVHVYGMGGRQLDNGLYAGMADDLPLLPSVHSQRGLVFFAVDHFTWSPSVAGSKVPYVHSIHKYSEDNYYFLSDREVEPLEQGAAQTSAAVAAESYTDFVERAVHEQELDHPGESGAHYLGEDFRSRPSQSFSFTLPDMVGDAAKVNVQFAAKTTSGSSSFMVKANGTQLPSTVDDQIASVNADTYFAYKSSVKDVEGLSGSLDLGIDFTYSGALFVARLDFIEVFYTRRLALKDGELYFYDTYPAGSGVTISGCSASTVVWDVTDPTRPLRVDYTLSGDKASFTVNTNGYREFVAFEPDAVSRAARGAGAVANQNLHAMPVPDMLIITLPEYQEGANQIAAMHERVDDMRVAVLTPDVIYNEFSGGKRDVFAFRRLLKMWFDRGEQDGHSIRYALMFGKPSYDNKMKVAQATGSYTPLPIWQSFGTRLTETASYSNDDVIGMLEDVQPSSFRMERAKLNVAVGRIPVASGEEGLQMAAKISKYVEQPDYGPWRSKVMIIADDDDSNAHINQAQNVYSRMRSRGNGSDFVYDRLYLDSYKRVYTGVGATYPQCTERMLRNYNDGVLLTNYIGHASPKGWGHEHLWEWQDIVNMTNPRLTFIYAATCGFAYWDEPTRSGAEHLMLNPEAGVIGFIAATRTVYIGVNGELNNRISQHFFERGDDGRALRFGDIYVRGQNEYNDDNDLRYAIMGDPAVRIPSPEYKVQIDRIAGADVLADGVDRPVIPAQSSFEVEGTIYNPDGSHASDFDGEVNLQLFDAERVITTYGQGQSGKTLSYNDRKSKLAVVASTVEGGRWKAKIQVPPEIDGNYSPALIAAYAWDGKGAEANGVSDNLYIYGYNEAAETDTVGPVIEKFYVNNENFESGGLVNSSPVVFARFTDESGINISDGAIGHCITLAIDGSDLRSDLSGYFEPDAESNGGSIVYPLSGIQAGKHTLTLSVWDNANNVSKASLDINVGAAVDPVIYDITTNVNPASESVVFNIMLDRPNTQMICNLGVYDLGGRKIWEYDRTVNTDIDSSVHATWNLCDASGARVPRGIYIYRARVETPEGTYSSKSKKLAVTAK